MRIASSFVNVVHPISASQRNTSHLQFQGSDSEVDKTRRTINKVGIGALLLVSIGGALSHWGYTPRVGYDKIHDYLQTQQAKAQQLETEKQRAKAEAEAKAKQLEAEKQRAQEEAQARAKQLEAEKRHAQEEATEKVSQQLAHEKEQFQTIFDAFKTDGEKFNYTFKVTQNHSDFSPTFQEWLKSEILPENHHSV